MLSFSMKELDWYERVYKCSLSKLLSRGPGRHGKEVRPSRGAPAAGHSSLGVSSPGFSCLLFASGSG